MATQTSNLGLTKPAYSETADIADINNNMDKVDAAVHGVQNGMAILANGNVHSAVTSGQYVYVRNHGTLAEGLYTATTNISTNATLSTSNLTAVPNNGALNTLRDDITSLNSIVGIQKHGKGSVAWGSNAEITRPSNASMLVFGGRSGVGFMIYIPESTNEYAPINTSAVSSVSVTMSKVTITAASSGYGSTLNYEYVVFI